MHPVDDMPALESAISEWIRLVGLAIDAFGVTVIVVGIVWSTCLFLWRTSGDRQRIYKMRIGRSLLLGLEVLVAADIVKTIAVEPTFVSLGVLGGLVAIRTFLGWTLVLEIESRWPWQEKSPPA